MSIEDSAERIARCDKAWVDAEQLRCPKCGGTVRNVNGPNIWACNSCGAGLLMTGKPTKSLPSHALGSASGAVEAEIAGKRIAELEAELDRLREAARAHLYGHDGGGEWERLRALVEGDGS